MIMKSVKEDIEKIFDLFPKLKEKREQKVASLIFGAYLNSLKGNLSRRKHDAEYALLDETFYKYLTSMPSVLLNL